MRLQVERLRLFGLTDVLPRAAFTINTRLNSAYKTILVSSSSYVGRCSRHFRAQTSIANHRTTELL